MNYPLEWICEQLSERQLPLNHKGEFLAKWYEYQHEYDTQHRDYQRWHPKHPFHLAHIEMRRFYSERRIQDDMDKIR